MKHLFTLLALGSFAFASFDNINTFQADFIQTLTDDKGKILKYSGDLVATKEQNAIWHYKKPVTKTIYINRYKITIIEPELEQVIIKRVEATKNFNFLKLLKNAKKIDSHRYLAIYEEKSIYINVDKDSNIKSIQYKDEFDNGVEIVFSNQKYNTQFDKNIFIPTFPLEYDIIQN